ncbi:segmentation protein cap'n'collar [Hetaerina americana]|uniref:segmentation protein cap'n'collar n=1 Tax=Hetaerina americana TaxID=62018 RepID=UPI003A7F6089
MIFPNPKKLRGEDVFHLVLALSLLGAQHPFQGVMYAGTLKDPAIHSSLLIGAYQTEVFHDLIALGRYSRTNSHWSRSCWEPRPDYHSTGNSRGRELSGWSADVEDLGSARGMPSDSGRNPVSEYGCSHFDMHHGYALGGSVTAFLLDVETSVNSEEAGEGGGGGEATGGGVETLKSDEDALNEVQFGPPAREEVVEDEGFDSSPLIKVEEEWDEEVVVKEESEDEAIGWDLSDSNWRVEDDTEQMVDWGDVILKTEVEDEEEGISTFGMPLSTSEEDHSYMPAEEVLSPNAYASSPSSELSREDMDLIEVLWKQDVDLGVPFDIFNNTRPEEGVGAASPLSRQSDDEDEIEKLKALAEKLHDCPKIDEDSAEDFLGPWAGLPYTVDLETGEYVFQEDAAVPSEGALGGCEDEPSEGPLAASEGQLVEGAAAAEDEEEQGVPGAEADVEEVVTGLSLSGFSLEEALQFVGIDEDEDDVDAKAAVSPEQVEGRADAKSVSDFEGENSGDLSDVISETDMQASHYGHHQVVPHQQPHHHHHHHHLYHSYHRGPVPQQHQQQGRAPLVRAVSMEQRWQDLANLLSLPPQGGGGVSVEGGCIPPHLQRLPGPQQQQQHRNHYHGAQSHVGAPLPSSLLHHGFKEEGNMAPMNGVLINNATLAPPQGEIETGPSPYPSLLGGTTGGCSAASDLGSALATSMSLNGAGGDNVSGMGNNLDAMGCFKTEPCPMPPTGPTPPHHMQHHHHHHHLPPNHHMHNHSSPDFLFYQHNSSSSGASSPSGGAPVTPTFPPPELHHGACSGAAPSADGLLSSILNDEELQLMDMAVNEGMYTMRMLEGATGGGGGIGRGALSSSSSTGGPVDESSDSAVSSMGSDGGEWAEVTTGRGHQHYPVTPLGQNECHPGGKFRSYEFGFTPSVLPGGPHGLPGGDMHGRRGRHDASHLGAGLSDGPPVAQKKHHMFGRRYFQEQGPQPSSPETGISGGPPMRSNSPAGGALAPQSSGKYAFGETAGAASPDFPSGGAGALNSPSHPGLRHARAPTHGDPGHGPRPMHNDTVLIPGIRDGTTMHNHSYSLPPEGASAPRGPPARDKMSSPRHRSLEVLASERDIGALHHMDHSPAESTRSCVEEVTPRRRHNQHHHSHMTQHQLSRDEKRARALGVPICVADIINLPMDEFNERLSKHDLTEAQLGLIRDIRRRGKNKVAAQNCRKRKLDQILSLADEVRRMRDRKDKLLRDRDTMLEQHRLAKEKFSRLYRHVFQALRDPEGRPYSQFEYSLQQSADGTVLLVPRAGGPPPDAQGGHSHSDGPGTSGGGAPGRSGV